MNGWAFAAFALAYFNFLQWACSPRPVSRADVESIVNQKVGYTTPVTSSEVRNIADEAARHNVSLYRIECGCRE